MLSRRRRTGGWGLSQFVRSPLFRSGCDLWLISFYSADVLNCNIPILTVNRCNGFNWRTLWGWGLHPHTSELSTTQDWTSRTMWLFFRLTGSSLEVFPSHSRQRSWPKELPEAGEFRRLCPGPHCAWSNHAVHPVSMVVPSTLEACERFPLLVLDLHRVQNLQFIFSLSKILLRHFFKYFMSGNSWQNSDTGACTNGINWIYPNCCK